MPGKNRHGSCCCGGSAVPTRTCGSNKVPIASLGLSFTCDLGTVGPIGATLSLANPPNLSYQYVSPVIFVPDYLIYNPDGSVMSLCPYFQAYANCTGQGLGLRVVWAQDADFLFHTDCDAMAYSGLPTVSTNAPFGATYQSPPGASSRFYRGVLTG